MGSPTVPRWERLQVELRRQLAAEIDLARGALLLQSGLPRPDRGRAGGFPGAPDR
jgi:hypothetical protein